MLPLNVVFEQLVINDFQVYGVCCVVWKSVPQMPAKLNADEKKLVPAKEADQKLGRQIQNCGPFDSLSTCFTFGFGFCQC